MPTVDEILAGTRHFVTYAMGFATAFGISSLGGADLNTISTSFDHILNGIKEIAVGLGPLIAAGMGWWATHKQSPASKVSDTAALPGVSRVVVKSTAPPPVLEMAADPAQPKVTRT